MNISETMDRVKENDHSEMRESILRAVKRGWIVPPAKFRSDSESALGRTGAPIPGYFTSMRVPLRPVNPNVFKRRRPPMARRSRAIRSDSPSGKKITSGAGAILIALSVPLT